jgi:hypothetical protein
MRSRAFRSVLLVPVLVCAALGAAAAQQRPTDTMEILREKVRADKKVVVASALELSEEEAKGFWPVYGAYQSDMITHYDRVAKLLSAYVAAYPAVTDEMATKMLGEFVALEVDHAAILQRYVTRFEKVLPPRKVARFYQVENKIRALLTYDLAREIPLVK